MFFNRGGKQRTPSPRRRNGIAGEHAREGLGGQKAEGVCNRQMRVDITGAVVAGAMAGVPSLGD